MTDVYDLDNPIRKVHVKEFDELRRDYLSFKHRSWTGRLVNNSFIDNTFIQEAYISLGNSIQLFEMGFFDCAFYSLRSAVDLSTEMVYFTDINNQKKSDNYRSWIRKSRFPSTNRLRDFLKKEGIYYSDMKEKMSSLFGSTGFITDVCNRLNKHVHKQGFDEFYIIRNNPSFMIKYPQENLTTDFIQLFKNVLEIVAVMRLAIDPFPILLLDPEINFRCSEFDEAYDEYLVSKYFLHNEIEEYKQTKIYQEAYEVIIKREKMSEDVLNIKKYSIYDRRS